MLKRYRDAVFIAASLLVIFQIYIYTAYPAFKNDDSPETITSAYTLGISHPPGYPVFTMAGKIFSLLPLGAPAFRINLFSVSLAMLVLLLSGMIIKKFIFLISGHNDGIMDLTGIFILAFSYIFWNQAIEAKGGVFILNLLFFSALICLGMRLLNSFNIRDLYLTAYVYGLSLANHWASMMILLPVFGYFFFKHRKKITGRRGILILLFFAAGISPYIYLPLRSGTDGIFTFMLKPGSWRNFWWTVSRSAYTVSPPPTLQVYSYQIKEFFVSILNNYSVLWVLMFAGGYITWKRNKEIFYLFSGIFLTIAFFIVIYHRGSRSVKWLIDVVLMPAQYVSMLFIVAGVYFISEFRGQAAFKRALISLMVLLVLVMGCVNFKKNYSRYNYISYDFSGNVIRTLEPRSFLFSAGDNNLRLSYIRKIQHRAETINLINVNSLESWGLDDFQKKYGNLDLKPGPWTENALKIINNFSNKNPVYMESYAGTFENNMGGLVEKPDGIFYKIAGKEENISPAIFEAYSYRGIYDTREALDRELSSFYGSMMWEKGRELFKESRYYQAIKLLKKAAEFPNEKDMEENIYFILAGAYKTAFDRNDERACFEKIIGLEPDFWPAYEAAGISYYQDKKLPEARFMFEQAIKYGSPDRQMLEDYLTKIEQMSQK